MRIAALYDIHANLPALEAVMTAMRAESVQLIVIGGDVLPGPMPLETLDCLQALPVPTLFLRGNGEREVLVMRSGGVPATVPPAYHPILQWTASQLTDAQARWIGSWPATVALQSHAGHDILCCHATPDTDTALFTSASSEAHVQRLFGHVSADLFLCGHTHVQFRRRRGDANIVNAGSVGMAISAAGAGFAEWLLLDGTSIEFMRTPYDAHAAAERIRTTGYPMAADFADRSVLAPPLLHDTIAAYTRAAEP